MKITANRKDELLKQKEEYDSRLGELRSKREAEEDAWHHANNDASRAVERKVLALIGPTSLEVRVDAQSDWHKNNVDVWRIYIKVNDTKKFSEDVALAWHWEVYLGTDGTIRKESGSWSGLQAVTSEQIADLEESVRIIKTLNTIDWDEVIHAPSPKTADYFSHELRTELRETENGRPNFEAQIRRETLNELLNGTTAIALQKDQYWNGKCWIIPTKISDKFVTGYIFPDYYLKSGYRKYKTVDEIKEHADERRTATANLVIDWNTNDYQTIDLTQELGGHVE